MKIKSIIFSKTFFAILTIYLALGFSLNDFNHNLFTSVFFLPFTHTDAEGSTGSLANFLIIFWLLLFWVRLRYIYLLIKEKYYRNLFKTLNKKNNICEHIRKDNGFRNAEDNLIDIDYYKNFREKLATTEVCGSDVYNTISRFRINIYQRIYLYDEAIIFFNNHQLYEKQYLSTAEIEY